MALVPLGLSLPVALSASASSTPVGFVSTDVKIEAKDINDIAAGASRAVSPDALAVSPHPLTVKSLAPAHAVEVHPYMTTGDTEDTHSLRVGSQRTNRR
jgi:uncharacterized membrane protein